MAGISDADSKRMYSWWWDSHISPKNSKWLQENVSDMDCKVKQMIKLLEEDADSFARRAEMYYKKRPELMKLVEEFYRAYRALAGRYDHATGVIRHAHKTIAEVFPNQVPLMFGDESPVSASTNETDPRTPEMPPPIRAPVDPDVLHKDALGFSSSHSAKRNAGGLKQLSDLCGSETGRARKGLNFNDGDEKGRNGHSDECNDLKAQILSESERAKKAEAEILALKDALSKVQAEKEATLTQYKLNSEKLSNLESEISCAQEDSRVLNERATKAEAEVQALKDALNKLEFEKESSLLQYQQSLQRIDDLNASISQAKKDAGEINERANKAEAETQILKQSLARAETDKETALVQYRQCLETISNLEERLLKAEEDARIINERAEKAEAEVENLKQTISKLIEDRETSELRYHQCLETIADLKLKLFNAQEETDRLSREVEEGVAKLKIVEEKCVVLERSNQTLHSELDTLFEKLGNQSQELMEKQSELGRLWTCVQEERSRFLEAETAFQTLQQLHSQSQEELKALDLELQIRSQILKDMETRNNDLQEEVQKVKDENKGLSELNLSSAASIKSLQEEVLSLRETIHKLEAEIELRVDQRNALQQEIYCLKEELRQIGKKHQSILEQVELVGFRPDCFGSSVKELQDENSKLKELNESENNKKMELLEKLEMMEKLAQKNLLLENSISDLNSELEAIRGKLQTLEEACQSLSEEKSGLVAEKDILTSRLHTATENSEKLSEKNKLLENSLFDANAELRDHRLKLKSLEDSCRLLSNDKSNLTTEREILISQMDVTRKALEDMEKGQAQLELKVSALQMERESSLQKIEELGLSLGAKDREYVSFVQLSEARLGYMESKIHHLQDEYQLELDRGVDAQMEIFVLQKCLQDILEKNSCLIVENQNIKDASKMSEKLISELEQENSGYRVQIDSLIGRIKVLKLGVHQILKRLEITPDIESGDENSQDQKNMNGILTKLDEMQNIILGIQNENQQSAIENFNLITLLQQLKTEADGISKEKSILEEELEFQHQQLSSSQDEMKKLICVNEELISKVKQGLNIEEALKKEVEDLHRQVLDMRGAYSVLQEENYKTLNEKISLTKSTVHLEEEKCKLEEYISLLLSETIYQSSLILLLEDVILVKFSETKKLSEDLSRLNSIKDKLEEKVRKIEDKLKYSETENLELKGLLEISEGALVSIRSACDQLSHEIANGKDELCQKEKELVEAKLLISVFENEKAELSKMVKNLECKYKETQSIQEDQEKQILTLREDYDEQIKETGRVNETNWKLKARLQNLIEELEETKMEKEKLNNELLKERDNAELWESQAGIFFGEMQVAAVHESLLEGMAQRLAEACENLESRNASKDVEIERLNERLSNLEDSNKGQQTRLVKYAQAAVLLDESIKSLENHIAIHCEAEDELIKGSGSVADKDVEYDPEGEDRFSEFHDMHLRLKAIQEAMIENEKLVILENTNTYSKLEAAMKKIQELKSGSRRSKRKQIHEISQEETETEVITKDIMLDQVSDCSSYGKSMRGTVVTDDQKLELWEINDLKIQKHDKEKGKSLSEESFVVDKLEISDRFTDPNQEVHKRKVLERLNSDLQKLTNLQITVEDMKNKVEIDNNGKKGKGDEYETIKGQLEEAKEEIEKLFNVNRKLMTKVENGLSMDLDEETESNRRRKISEHARRGSEKVGRLQFEIQRIHLLLMKLEGEKGKLKNNGESKTRVLLRDYMYGGHKKKKKTTTKATKNKFGFCACVQPHSP